MGITSVGNHVVSTCRANNSLSSGSFHTCGIASNGEARCWGRDNYDQRTTPSNLGRVVAVFAADFHNCAIKTDSTIACWGQNYHEQATVPDGIRAVRTMTTG